MTDTELQEELTFILLNKWRNCTNITMTDKAIVEMYAEKFGFTKRPQDNNLVPLDEIECGDKIMKVIMNNWDGGAVNPAELYGKIMREISKFGKDNSGMVANEEFRLDRVEVFGGLAGKGMKHMYTLRPTRYENEQPPKERKVSLEEIVNIFPMEWPKYKCVIIAKRIYCLIYGNDSINATEERKGE